MFASATATKTTRIVVQNGSHSEHVDVTAWSFVGVQYAI